MNKIYAFVTTYYPDKIVEKNIKKLRSKFIKQLSVIIVHIIIYL